MEPNEELQELTQRLEAVEAAMERLDQGTYGRCESCGNELTASLLEIDPTSLLCSNCSATRNDG